MKLKHLGAIGALLAAPIAQAQTSGHAPDPTDPGVPVPVLVYESSMPAKRMPSIRDQASPDKVWRTANDTVTVSDGHGHGHAAPPTPTPTSAPRADNPQPSRHGNHH